MPQSPDTQTRFRRAAPPLLGGDTIEEYRRAVGRGVDRVAAHLDGVQAPFSGAQPEQLEAAVAEIDLDRPLRSLDGALDEIQRLYLDDAVFFHHPRYLAHLNCPVAIPALLAEAILAPVNSSLDTYDQSGGATLIERRLVDWTAERLGLPAATADGVFTSGGTQSNLQALHLARDEALAGARTVAETSPLRIFASAAGHFSVVKSARLLGLGEDAVTAIPTDDAKRMRVDALGEALRESVARGERPMAIVATAGTTDFGSIDPLAEVAALAREHGAWLHVDAAYGCGLLVSERRGHLLDGIAHADSVTVDFHKSFFQPISSSALIVRDGATLRHVTHHADYLNPAASLTPNQVDKSLQTTRRFDALKLWLTLRMMGAERIGELFDGVCDLADAAFHLLDADDRFEVPVRPTLSTLVFRHVAGDDANRRAREALMRSGEALVAATTVDGAHHLKFTLLNPATTLEDVAAVLDLIDEHAAVHTTETERQAA